MAATPGRKILDSHGRRGDRVRVFTNPTRGLVTVQHAFRGEIVHTRSWDDTPTGRREAKAYAAAYFTARAVARPAGDDLTLYELFERYQLDQFPHLADNTQRLYREHWKLWQDRWGAHFLVDRTTVHMPGEFRRDLEGQDYAVRTIRNTIGTVKTVYRWAEAHELIARNPLHLYRYKLAKDKRPTSPEEYRGEEARAIIAQLDPAHGAYWRPWVAIVLCAMQGARQHSVLHLAVEDIQLGGIEWTPDGPRWRYGTITWQGKYDKTGTTWQQPLRLLAQIAIEVALEWRERNGYEGPWLIPAARKDSGSATYTKKSVWLALQKAEGRAGVEKLAGRAGHALRRMLAGDVTAETGDFLLGLRAIGDRDPKRATEYIKTRTDRLEDAFREMDRVDTLLRTEG